MATKKNSQNALSFTRIFIRLKRMRMPEHGHRIVNIQIMGGGWPAQKGENGSC